MTLGNILYQIIIGPLQFIFEVIYSFANKFTGNPGLSIIALSLAMNVLVLPLYIRADAMQEEERDIEKKLSKGVNHIKKTFKGDERMMMLQTFYRHNDYKPTYVLKGAMSLFLEIPFFIAAYQFLSHLSLLEGVSFGPIKDLGQADGLIVIGSVAINLLPILMTAINAISTSIFTKGYPAKTKIQLYGMALFFLVFLYDSPAGLVFYWTLNNLFSLGKTIVYKIIDYVKEKKGVESLSEVNKETNGVNKQKKGLFVVGMVFLAVLTGMLIPSAVIADSPSEFVNIYNYHNPIWYIVGASCLSTGTFILWANIFYNLSHEKGKRYLETIFVSFSIAGVITYMFFMRTFGTLLPSLNYTEFIIFEKSEKIINLAIFIVVFLFVLFLNEKLRKIAGYVFVVLLLAVSVMSVRNIVKINSELVKLDHSEELTANQKFTLSKKGKNVVAFMLDRALGEAIPYIMSEKPELRDRFDGFTYYPNTISYGAHTIIASPALFGGYEYIPEKLNERDEMFLEDKQNEALCVMPVKFMENGYNVTVINPPYAGYEVVPDLSIYDDYPEINRYHTYGEFGFDIGDNDKREIAKSRNFYMYSLMKIMPVWFQDKLYDSGRYHDLVVEALVNQSMDGLTKAEGMRELPVNSYIALTKMSDMTEILDDTSNNFLMVDNDTAHDPMLYQREDYTPALRVDNSEFGEYDRKADQFFGVAADRTLVVTENIKQITHYHANMAAILRVADWLDYLKENELYDNTRIILVSDHARDVNSIKEMNYEGMDENCLLDPEWYLPLMMVKDFNSSGFKLDEEFMTNADTPMLALSGLGIDMTNPFTGGELSSEKKKEQYQYIFASDDISPEEDHCGNVFDAAPWFRVDTSDIWDVANWKYQEEATVLPIR